MGVAMSIGPLCMLPFALMRWRLEPEALPVHRGVIGARVHVHGAARRRVPARRRVADLPHRARHGAGVRAGRGHGAAGPASVAAVHAGHRGRGRGRGAGARVPRRRCRRVAPRGAGAADRVGDHRVLHAHRPAGPEVRRPAALLGAHHGHPGHMPAAAGGLSRRGGAGARGGSPPRSWGRASRASPRTRWCCSRCPWRRPRWSPRCANRPWSSRRPWHASSSTSGSIGRAGSAPASWRWASRWWCWGRASSAGPSGSAGPRRVAGPRGVPRPGECRRSGGVPPVRGSAAGQRPGACRWAAATGPRGVSVGRRGPDTPQRLGGDSAGAWCGCQPAALDGRSGAVKGRRPRGATTGRRRKYQPHVQPPPAHSGTCLHVRPSRPCPRSR